MQGWNDEWEDTSKAGKSRTIDDLDDIVDDLQGESASKPQAKKAKKVAGVKKTTKKRARRESGSSEAIVNPEEQVRTSWLNVKPKEFRKDHLVFNLYAFGRSTSDDPRFYCKMHEQIFEKQLETTKNSHVPWEYFSLAQARDVWPDVMEMRDFHQVSKLMTVNTVFHPDLIKQFYATVFFSTTEHGEKVLTWMTAETPCSATMAEFGALIGLEVLPVAPLYVRLHLSRQLTPSIGLRHCYPPGKFTLQPKVAHMYPF